MDTSVEETPIIIAQSGPLDGQKWMLDTTLVLGRDPECDIVIPDRQVSRQHARFVQTRNGIRLEDLGSKNGTHHNGNRINSETVIRDGDIIQVAFAQEFIFISADSTIPLGLNGPEKSRNDHSLRLEKRSRQVWLGKKEVLPPLSVAQFQLLELLYEQQGRVVSRNKIVAGIWGDEGALEVSNQALDALIRRLRDRLAGIEPNRKYILTVRGHGLRLEDDPEEEQKK
jgi:DNA-binding winged helix-turn-helix (wHTH) protein